MVSGMPYQRVGPNGEVNSLLFKYKLAKALTMVSLVAVFLMALGSLVYPELSWRGSSNVAEDHPVAEAPVEPASYGGVKSKDKCQLPSKIMLPMSPDGTYSPPSPDDSLLKVLEYVAPDDYDKYCQSWDPVSGFTDEIPYNKNGECGTWQAKYRALHERRLEQLERLKAGDLESFQHEDKPMFISYYCKEVPKNSNRGCGGLADRMSGMISTFFYGLITDRAYLAHWANGNPIPLELLFEKPNIDWSFDPIEMRRLFDQEDSEFFSFKAVDTLNQKWKQLGETMFPNGSHQDFRELWTEKYLEVRSNRAYIIRTYQESAIYPDMMAKIGLSKENTFGCLTDFLFQPTIGSRRFYNAFKALFKLDSVLTIGMQIRTDDNAIANPQLDQNNLQKWDYFLTCANQLADAKRQAHHKRVVYFLITDSTKLRDEFVSMNENSNLAQRFLQGRSQHTSMVVTGLPIDHIEPDQVSKYINVTNPVQVTQERMLPGVNSAVIENWLLSAADYRIISPQGYGKLAAFHSNSDNSTIALPRVTLKARAPDCSKPNAFVTYDWLSTQWSLG
ncbi:uncharacterized protein BYT42DRAFT_558149 [Radiomyces spectabilis]|uniref:uncharacterized protein n=1 Tax=Radiomyces spectabilis TaxID=64574 RepID=UPI00221E39C8|nr:uncharacterized protein BYT42DRAFT_558149 [Radiomyces spectabilis]KAI8391809.1 hypothetical protein BYT42DRAFT_558149 [Radiomyces spectabilis]